MTFTKLDRSVSGKESQISVISTPRAAKILLAAPGSSSLRTETNHLWGSRIFLKLIWQDFAFSYFTPDLCRPIFFNFKEETTVEGIHGFKYALDEGFWGNSSTNSSNWCYNPEPDMSKNINILDFFGMGEVGQNYWNWALVFWLKLVTNTMFPLKLSFVNFDFWFALSITIWHLF